MYRVTTTYTVVYLVQEADEGYAREAAEQKIQGRTSRFDPLMMVLDWSVNAVTEKVEVTVGS